MNDEEANIHAFLADRGNAALRPDLWKETQRWLRNGRNTTTLARTVSSFLKSTPYIYKDVDTLDLDHLIG